MSEPTLICSAPELANSAQKIALYSHYAAAVAGFAVGGVMIARSRVQEKIPHILGAIAAFGIGLTALYSQWEFNQFLYAHREIASNAVAVRSGMWAWWATLIFVGLALTPGFKFKRMQKLALIPLIILSFLSFGLSSAGEALASAVMTANPPAEMLGSAEEIAGFKALAKAGAFGSALIFGLPALVFAIGLIVTYIISQAKKVQKLSENNRQERTGIRTLVAVCIPAVSYSAGTFLVASNELGLDRAVLLFNCGDLMAMFFLLCATMSLLGVPANFPKPPKPVKPPKEKKSKKKDEPPAVPAEGNPNMLDQQQAYAQAYAQQLYAQQQAYAQYYAQQQAAQQQAPQQTAQPGQEMQAQSAPQPQPASDPAAMAAYQQQQAQYYAQQQAYAAYQQQQQAYQQAYAAQQQYAPTQQQAYAQAYAQQQAGFRQQHQAIPTGTQPTRVAVPRPGGVAGVKKVGGVRPIKKIR